MNRKDYVKIVKKSYLDEFSLEEAVMLLADKRYEVDLDIFKPLRHLCKDSRCTK